MAAPCRRMAGRRMLSLFSCFRRTADTYNGVRQFFDTSIYRATLQTTNMMERVNSPWNLMAAVCLQRLPVISADCSPIEEQFRQMMLQMELEKSLLSDHELRLLEDAESMSRKQSDDYESDEEDGHGDQDIVLAQDLEDSWELKLKGFQPALRVRGDKDKDLASVERCLAEPLLLLCEQQVGDKRLWLLPQTQWQEGETLRHTAERALASLPAPGFRATFLGNAPCGVYKYTLPKAARTESLIGTKVFFFRAILSEQGLPAATNKSCLWLKKSELERYLQPAYMKKVERFLLEQ